jgi:hypothetical protein
MQTLTTTAAFAGLVPFTADASTSLRALLVAALGLSDADAASLVITLSDYEVEAAVSALAASDTSAQAALAAALGLAEQQLQLSAQATSRLRSAGSASSVVTARGFGTDADAAVACASRLAAAVPAAAAGAALSSPPQLSAVVSITVRVRSGGLNATGGSGIDMAALRTALSAPALLATLGVGGFAPLPPPGYPSSGVTAPLVTLLPAVPLEPASLAMPAGTPEEVMGAGITPMRAAGVGAGVGCALVLCAGCCLVARARVRRRAAIPGTLVLGSDKEAAMHEENAEDRAASERRSAAIRRLIMGADADSAENAAPGMQRRAQLAAIAAALASPAPGPAGPSRASALLLAAPKSVRRIAELLSIAAQVDDDDEERPGRRRRPRRGEALSAEAGGRRSKIMLHLDA